MPVPQVWLYLLARNLTEPYAAAGGTGLLAAYALGWNDVLDLDSASSMAIAAFCVGLPALLSAWQWWLRTAADGRWSPALHDK